MGDASSSAILSANVHPTLVQVIFQTNRRERKEGVDVKSRLFRTSRVADVSAAVAHALAWAAFLWIVLNPCFYRGVSATPAALYGLDQGQRDIVHHCAFFSEINGLWATVPIFVPVVLTGLALITLLIWKGPRLGATLILAGLATVLLAFCAMGYLSFGVIYSPAAFVLIIAAIAHWLRFRSIA